jgi:hypothetical protein
MQQGSGPWAAGVEVVVEVVVVVARARVLGRVARKIVGGAAESLLSAGWDLFSLTRRRSVVVVVVSGISARQRRWHSTASYKVE